MIEINLNRMVRRGSVATLSVQMLSYHPWTVIGTIRGPRHSRGWRKHLRRMKEARK